MHSARQSVCKVEYSQFERVMRNNNATECWWRWGCCQNLKASLVYLKPQH